MDYSVKGKDIIVSEKDLDLDETLDCGQAFRWKKVPSDFDCTYEGFFVMDLRANSITSPKQLGMPHFIYYLAKQ